MENFALPTVSLGAVPCVTRTRSSEAPCAWGPDSLAGELGAACCSQAGLQAAGFVYGEGSLGTSWATTWHHSAPRGGSGAPMAVGAFWGPGWVLQPHATSELHWFVPHVFPACILKAVSAVPRTAGSSPLSLPPCQRSSLWDSSSELLAECCAVPVPQCPSASHTHLYPCPVWGGMVLSMLAECTVTEPATSATHVDREGTPVPLLV